MRHILAILFGMTLASGAAIGADTAKFSEVDADGNGKLSQSEAAEAGIDLSAADADGNGALSKAEYQAALESKMKEGES